MVPGWPVLPAQPPAAHNFPGSLGLQLLPAGTNVCRARASPKSPGRSSFPQIGSPGSLLGQPGQLGDFIKAQQKAFLLGSWGKHFLFLKSTLFPTKRFSRKDKNGGEGGFAGGGFLTPKHCARFRNSSNPQPACYDPAPIEPARNKGGECSL